jgi:hypothetical protein
MSVRIKKTSHSERYQLKSQQANRLLRLTGSIKKQSDSNYEEINEIDEIDEIVRSYKIEDALGPRMRMKWKSPYDL